MKTVLLILFFMPVLAHAQIYPGDGTIGSATFTFADGDSLSKTINSTGGVGNVMIDTSLCTLWQIGSTVKMFSIDTVPAKGIMTDTLHPYPANANDFFVLHMDKPVNAIVNIWHRYNTDSLHAGGIVEFSTDSGATWVNIVECLGIRQENFYGITDTLLTGEPAFTGNSNGQRLSRFQFWPMIPIRTSSTLCSIPAHYWSMRMDVRFRFKSDTTIDTLAGWKIDSIRIDIPHFTSKVKSVDEIAELQVYPDPVTSNLTISATEQINYIVITNLLGQTVYTGNCKGNTTDIDVSNLTNGLYFIRVLGANNYHAVRKFLKE